MLFHRQAKRPRVLANYYPYPYPAQCKVYLVFAIFNKVFHACLNLKTLDYSGHISLQYNQMKKPEILYVLLEDAAAFAI